MGRRREARERAVQFLFQYDLNRPPDLDQALEEFWASQHPTALALEKGNALWGQKVELPPLSVEEAAVRLFADPLILGTIKNLSELDGIIQKYLTNWKINRLAGVDRTVLRLAIYEMLHRDDIPPIVSIDEAVDIAKKFSTDESGRFVNGILDQVRTDLLGSSKTGK